MSRSDHDTDSDGGYSNDFDDDVVQDGATAVATPSSTTAVSGSPKVGVNTAADGDVDTAKDEPAKASSVNFGGAISGLWWAAKKGAGALSTMGTVASNAVSSVAGHVATSQANGYARNVTGTISDDLTLDAKQQEFVANIVRWLKQSIDRQAAETLFQDAMQRYMGAADSRDMKRNSSARFTMAEQKIKTADANPIEELHAILSSPGNWYPKGGVGRTTARGCVVGAMVDGFRHYAERKLACLEMDGSLYRALMYVVEHEAEVSSKFEVWGNAFILENTRLNQEAEKDQRKAQLSSSAHTSAQAFVPSPRPAESHIALYDKHKQSWLDVIAKTLPNWLFRQPDEGGRLDLFGVLTASCGEYVGRSLGASRAGEINSAVASVQLQRSQPREELLRLLAISPAETSPWNAGGAGTQPSLRNIIMKNLVTSCAFSLELRLTAKSMPPEERMEVMAVVIALKSPTGLAEVLQHARHIYETAQLSAYVDVRTMRPNEEAIAEAVKAFNVPAQTGGGLGSFFRR